MSPDFEALTWISEGEMEASSTRVDFLQEDDGRNGGLNSRLWTLTGLPRKTPLSP